MKRVVLDASALMIFFADRSGADVVDEIIGRAVEGKTQVFMSVVNWGEVYYATWRDRGPHITQRIIAEIAQLPIDIVDADWKLAKQAAELKALRSLPYVDCFAAALGIELNAAVVTSDRDFGQVEDKLDLVWLPGS